MLDHIQCDQQDQYGKHSHNAYDRTNQLLPGALRLWLGAKFCGLSRLFLGDLGGSHVKVLLSFFELLLIKTING